MKRGLVLAAIALLVALGCSDLGPDPYAAVAGTYILHSVDGQTIPAELASGPQGTIVITTGSLTLRRDRTFTEIWTVRFTPPEGEPEHGALAESGTYELSGQAITFHLPAAPGRDEMSLSGTIRGDTLTYTVGGRVVVYLD